ncbi:methyl-accepting chemotaxis protein [Propionivibrio sp.]|uniref:methyl-accepting chemotaxis protein n=1 Tax=Propionivibrio sp. TaxID=2212460 RepID=UPI002637BEF9|nr:methyl-accepting chemotaxis protein [Propionivibrio sp.]
MKNLTIKLQIIILSMLAVGGMVVSSSFGIYQLSRFNTHQAASMADIRAGMHTLLGLQLANVELKTQVQEWKNILIRGNNQEDFTKYENSFLASEKAVQERLGKELDILKKENDPGNDWAIADIEKLIKTHAELGTIYKAALSGFNKADPEAGKKVDLAVKGKDRPTTEGITKLVETFEKGELAHLEKQVVAQAAAFTSSRNLLLVMMAIGLVLSGGIAFFSLKQISSQIADVQETTLQIKETLDLTRRISVSGRNELAEVSTSVNVLLDQFQVVVRRMKEAGGHVSDASNGLSQSVAQLSVAVEQQNEATCSMAASVEEMAVSVSHVSNSSAAAKGISQESLSSADQGGQVIDKTVGEMVQMAQTVQGTSHTMEELSKRTDEIGSIVSVIKEVADQTNLLALNAAIEAARAGEQGRGFAVVADEVRKLAERTSSSTKEIAGVISAIQSETRNAVTDMRQIVSQVTANADSARQAGEAIALIRKGSQRVVDVSSDIATALQEQTSASELIAKQVEVISSMSEENTSAMGAAKDAAAEMKRLSTQMHEMVERFRV